MISATRFTSFVNRHHTVIQETYRCARQIVLELVKVVAAQAFLKLLSQRLLGQSFFSSKVIWEVIVLAPLIEEIAFRGVLQKGIELAQRVWNRFFRKRELTEQERGAQLTFRVHLTALVFGAAHLLNTHPTWASKMVQVTVCYVGSIGYGYLREKYQTVSLSIIAHGVNNTMALCVDAFPHHKHVYLALYIANDLGAYILGTTQWLENAAEKVKETACHVYISLTHRLSGWQRPVRQPAAAAAA